MLTKIIITNFQKILAKLLLECLKDQASIEMLNFQMIKANFRFCYILIAVFLTILTLQSEVEEKLWVFKLEKD